MVWLTTSLGVRDAATGNALKGDYSIAAVITYTGIADVAAVNDTQSIKPLH